MQKRIEKNKREGERGADENNRKESGGEKGEEVI